MKRFEAATESATSHAHFAVHNKLLEILNISSDSDDMDEEPTKEPSHNNPEEATNYLKAVNNLLDKSVNDIRGFNPYARQDAYQNFVHTLSQLLLKLDSTYFTHMNTQLVLDTIPDKECVAFLEHPEETADKVQQHVSSDNIPTGPEVMTKMHLDENITTFDQAGQQAITHLFSHLQGAHNHMSQVAAAVVQLSKVSSPISLHLY